ncbi:hypothetical protein PHET_03922 [Paragonimus heterotremus]|uniref:LIM zinc-binding domain-containing protein n=1 Tax=Paragonimus heterotremus TaxID=100268 RepID=A0A8J4SQK6_9TREM|nr:hypothetical protein PHET_03922 [Paragonimus heterotremus]
MDCGRCGYVACELPCTETSVKRTGVTKPSTATVIQWQECRKPCAKPNPCLDCCVGSTTTCPGDACDSLCYVCCKPVHPCNRIFLSNRILHANCAKCCRCQILLGITTYREFEGRLYCDIHYAQTGQNHQLLFRNRVAPVASVFNRWMVYNSMQGYNILIAYAAVFVENPWGM